MNELMEAAFVLVLAGAAVFALGAALPDMAPPETPPALAWLTDGRGVASTDIQPE